MALKIGDPAPDFTLKDNHGEPAGLSEFKGKKVIHIDVLDEEHLKLEGREKAEKKDGESSEVTAAHSEQK